MSRRRESRRRQRATRRQRDPGEGPAVAEAPALPSTPRDISWTGLFGGLLGVAALVQAPIYSLVSSQGSLLGASVLALFGLIYLPAIWVSLVNTANRQRVLKWVLVATLVLVALGMLFVGPGFATLMLAPSTLLAIASGVVFQGRRSADKR